MATYTLTVKWVRLGRKDWEWWWVFLHGKNITREATADEHISFVNYDLKNIGAPTLSWSNGDTTLCLNSVPSHQLQNVIRVLARHGFDVQTQVKQK